MNPELQAQLEQLRKRIARIDRKFTAAPPPPRFDPRPHRYELDPWPGGREVETPFGRHFEIDRLYERHRRHGSVSIHELEEIAAATLHDFSGNAVPPAAPDRLAFLDTETTGLAGGTGTCAFLIGVGSVCPDGFRVRQFFMRDYGEEHSLLHALSEYLAGFEVLVTYNGRVYDQPLLETRYRLQRTRPPFERLPHLDLLYGARRLWKLRFESCRLVELETQVLGVERQGDLPGDMIPFVYFEYLRTREAEKLTPILHHNATDILTLACLTKVVPAVYREPGHGAEMIGLGRWLQRQEKHEEALPLLRRALQSGLPDDLLFRTMWDIAALERKCGRPAAALALYSDLAGCRNPHRTAALEELAKHYEHREKNHAMALEMTRAALELADSESLRRREARLARRVAPQRLPL
ncbi:MAG: ribonuclease H-like domain-containing protein [Bryobacteraceae bacterium]|nr:ribonuclease H-like domain-containing protein [Bryobacteraceae bacterium]